MTLIPAFRKLHEEEQKPVTTEIDSGYIIVT